MQHHSWKYTTLLAILVAAVLARPFLFQTLAGRIIFGALMTLFFIAAIHAVSRRGRARTAAVVLGLLSIVFRWMVVFNHGKAGAAALALGRAVEIAFLAIIVALLLAAILRELEVTLDNILGAFAGYLLIAMAFGITYNGIENWMPGSFRVHESLAGEWNSVDQREWILGYFSCCTLMTVGYGDITPVHPTARGLSMIEAMVGQLYMAVLVATLVGVSVGQAITRRRDTSARD